MLIKGNIYEYTIAYKYLVGVEVLKYCRENKVEYIAIIKHCNDTNKYLRC